MANNGAVAIQACAWRACALDQYGNPTSTVIQDDRSLVKLELKPVLEAGVEITPKSACGVPTISYKDCDRYKRWDVAFTLGDWDPEALALLGQGSVITSAGSAGRSVSDGVLTLNENTLSSATAAFVTDDVGRSVVDAGITVASCTTTATSDAVTTTGSFTSSGVVVGMPVSGTGIASGTTVAAVNSPTSLTLSQNATASGTVTLTFSRLPASTYITEVVSGTEARLSANALASGTALSITFGAQPVATIGYQFPHVLLVPCPNGISLEIWPKLIMRGTEFQGFTPYPSAGTPTTSPSGYVRVGIPRAYLWHGDQGYENKEEEFVLNGWAIENPNWLTGPNDDWRTSGLPGVGPAIDTTAVVQMMADFQLPSPLLPGTQTI